MKMVLGISIHAPIVGCDLFFVMNILLKINFNPRTHRGVRQQGFELVKEDKEISIHAPIVGCDSAFAMSILLK